MKTWNPPWMRPAWVKDDATLQSWKAQATWRCLSFRWGFIQPWSWSFGVMRWSDLTIIRFGPLGVVFHASKHPTARVRCGCKDKEHDQSRLVVGDTVCEYCSELRCSDICLPVFTTPEDAEFVKVKGNQSGCRG